MQLFIVRTKDLSGYVVLTATAQEAMDKVHMHSTYSLIDLKAEPLTPGSRFGNVTVLG